MHKYSYVRLYWLALFKYPFYGCAFFSFLGIRKPLQSLSVKDNKETKQQLQQKINKGVKLKWNKPQHLTQKQSKTWNVKCLWMVGSLRGSSGLIQHEIIIATAATQTIQKHLNRGPKLARLYVNLCEMVELEQLQDEHNHHHHYRHFLDLHHGYRI